MRHDKAADAGRVENPSTVETRLNDHRHTSWSSTVQNFLRQCGDLVDVVGTFHVEDQVMTSKHCWNTSPYTWPIAIIHPGKHRSDHQRLKRGGCG